MTVLNTTSVPPPLADPTIEPPAPASPDPMPRWVLAVLGGVFLVVTFVQDPGQIIDDTKLPVIMAPLAWMQSALHLWNPTVASGSVQTETFGYLFPMAPFFELTHLLHIPVWCAERLWFALLLTFGAWGMIRLAEALGIGKRWARVLGAIAFCVAPIVVDWAAISVDLLAVVFLPWVLRPLIVGSREGSPRRAAAKSGVAVALMGGVNATVIFSTLPLAVIWLLTRSAGPRRRSLTVWWIISVGLACFWWIVPTILQGKYGYNYLPYTETAAVTTATTSAFEALRGASFWQNYDNLGGPLIRGGWILVTSPAAIISTAVVTALGLAGLIRRIPERLFLVASMTFGVVVIAVGYSGSLGGPLSHPVVRLLSSGLGPLRNVSKFSPDVTLPLSLGLASLVSTVSWDGVTTRWQGLFSRVRPRALLGAVAVIAVFLAAMPFWRLQAYPTGGFSAIPSYWTQAANWLDGHQGRQTALLVPGSNFADYTWGKPQDEPLSVLASTSTTVRSIIPFGSDGNTEMLSTIEAVLASGTAQAGTAQYLSRSGVDYVVERNDLSERETGAPPPAQVHQVLNETPGLVEVASFGPYLPPSQVAQGDLPVYNSESSLHLRPIEIFQVEPAASEVQTFPEASPVIVSGSTQSLLPISGSVLLGRAAVLAIDPHSAGASSQADATWAITDGNQRRAVAFGRIDDDVSYLLGAGQRPYGLPTTTPLSYGTQGATDAQTVAAPLGAASVTATSAGSTTLQLEPSEGPASAFDGDPSTAWIASGAGHSLGQSLTINFDQPVAISRIGITPLDDSPLRPSVAELEIRTDSGSVFRPIPVHNSPVWVTVKAGSTKRLTITIRAVRTPIRHTDPQLGIGITEVAIPGVEFQPAMRLPSDEVTAFSGTGRQPPVVSISDPVTNPNLDFSGPPSSAQPFARTFTLPSSFDPTITGTAVPNPGIALQRLLSSVADAPDPTVKVTATSSLRDLPKFRPQNLAERSNSPWIAGLDDQKPTVNLSWDGARTVDSISLGLTSVASRPTEVVISSGRGSQEVAIPRSGGTISFKPILTDALSLHFVAKAVKYSALPTGSTVVGLPQSVPVALPLGLTSIAVPALNAPQATPPAVSSIVSLACGSGPALRVDNSVISTQLTGSITDLVDLQPMDLRVCNPGGINLAPGTHTISFPSGSAFRVTSLLLEQPTLPASISAAQGRSVRVGSWTAGKRTVAIGGGQSSYLRVAQNFSSGWSATLDGKKLGPVMLDGWQQGWVIPAGAGGTVTMTFQPDRAYRIGLLLGALLLLALILLSLMDSRGSASEPIGPRRRLSVQMLAAFGAIAVFLVGGWLILTLLPLLVFAQRKGNGAMALVAALSFSLAGVVVAVDPSTTFGQAAGAFSPAAQSLSVVAFAAVIATVIVEERRQGSS